MTNEELDEARGKEAGRLYVQMGSYEPHPAQIAARLTREGWTPPEPVDPDLLAAREYLKATNPQSGLVVENGAWDTGRTILTYLAGIKHGRFDSHELADDIIALLIPPGHVVVPMEPTREMLNAAPAREDPGEESMYATIYRAMLAARPAGKDKP